MLTAVRHARDAPACIGEELHQLVVFQFDVYFAY